MTLSRFMNLALALAMIPLGAAVAADHQLEPRQQLTFVLSESRPGGEQVAQNYFSRAFPMAQANGMRELTTFKVQKTLVGGGAPQGSGLYLWPSREAAKRARLDATYVTELRPLRSQAWIDLQSVDMQIVSPMTLRLARDKTYTAALVWGPEAIGFANKFEGKARLVLDLPASRYENLKDGETSPPDRVVILEWNAAEDIARFMARPPAKPTRLEWYQLGFWD